jgi:phospho-N-acetylmuramoyl-pentapeptide-transferase
MGGIIFMIPMIVVTLIMSQGESGWDHLPAALIATLGFGLIGFVDDFIKVSKKRSLGLTPLQKIVPQLVLAIAFSVWAYTGALGGLQMDRAVYHPRMGSGHLVRADDGCL